MTSKTISLLLLISSFLVSANAATTSVLSSFCLFENETIKHDLRPLSLKSGFFTVNNGTNTFLINICSNENNFKLPSTSKSNSTTECDKRTSICLINQEYANGFALAKLNRGLLNLDKDNNLQMTFSQAHPQKILGNCSAIDTVIELVCEISAKPLEKRPSFKSFSNCTLRFEWESSEACVAQQAEIEPHFENNTHVFRLESTNVTLNLKDVFDVNYTLSVNYDESSKQESYIFTISNNMSNYLKDSQSLNQFARNLSSCSDAFVCQLKQDRQFIRPIGKMSKDTVLKHAGGSFHLFMPSNSKCGRVPNENTAVIFNLFCNQKTKEIKFIAENNACHYIFDLSHPKVCEFETEFARAHSHSLAETEKQQSLHKNEMSNVNSVVKSSQSTVHESSVNGSLPSDTMLKTNLKSESIVAQVEKKVEKNLIKSVDDSLAHRQVTTNTPGSNSNTTLFGFLILVIVSVMGIVLAIFSLINDDRRAWLQNRVRRVIKPQTGTGAFHYSQLSTNMRINNNQANENLQSPYMSTVRPKSEQMQYDSSTTTNRDLRHNSTNLRPSIREQLDRLHNENDNDLGVSRNDFNSMAFRSGNLLRSSKDEAELNLLN